MTEQRVLDGRYEVGELIGRGGMADVHLGRDVRLGRSVAIKLLRADLARDPQFQSRFRREAQAVAGLNHPSIVSVYDTGDQHVGDGLSGDVNVPFIVMEHVGGRTLRDLIRAGQINIDLAIEHTLGVLSALEYSHRSGIVHRDIKPANVMVTADGGVKVMDFGIARAIADSGATMTQTQAVIGTAQYLSPEQARGETVDARSDLYSAACLLYEMLTGRPPFVGESPVSVAYQHVREMPEPPSHHNPQVSEALDSVLARALQKNRHDRFQDAAAFRRALRAARTGVALSPPAPTVPEQDAAATAVVPMVAGAAGVAQDSAYRPEDRREAASQTRSLGYGAGAHEDDGAEPETRAMAKVKAGGSLTTAESDDEYHANSAEKVHESDPRRGRRRAWITVLVIALLLMLGAGAYLLNSALTAQPPTPDMVEVPAVRNMSEAEAITALYDLDLEPFTERTVSDEVAEGDAIGTTPEAGASVEVGSAIELLVSSGPSSIALPEDLLGQSEATVRDRLGQLGLVGGSTEFVNSASVAEDNLIATEPGLGEQVPAGSTVNLILSTGNVTMPALTGRDQEDAEAALQDPAVDLPYTIEEEENSVVEPGTVVSQSIPEGNDVAQGTDVVFTVAVEPEESDTSGENGEPAPPEGDEQAED